MKQTKIDIESNGRNFSDKGMSPADQKALIEEFLKEFKEDVGATLVLNGNGNGSKNLIFNSLVVQTTDQETSDMILEKIKHLPTETFEDVLLAIAEQIKSRNSEN